MKPQMTVSVMKARASLGKAMKTKGAMLLAAAAVFFTIASHEREARASSGQLCTVTVVWYDQPVNSQGQPNPGQLKIYCAETGSDPFFALVNEPTCSAQNRSLDTLKVWSSMATAFQLAGRKVFIDYNPPSGTCGVKTINHVRTG